MGQSQSTINDNNLFLAGKPGDTFTFTIPNVVDTWETKNGTSAGSRFAPFEITKGSTFKHLIFNGILTKEVSSGIFTYKFTSLVSTDELGQKNGKPTWTAGPDKSDGWMSTYIQSRDTDNNGYLQPPSITSGPNGNLVPIVMNSQSTSGFKLDGDFNDLKPSQIYKFMNDYATQSLAIVTPTHPFYDEIIKASSSYTSNAQIKQSFSEIRTRINSIVGNPKIVLITADKTGQVRTDTTFNEYVNNSFKAITRGNKESKYIGVEIDPNHSYESDYNSLQSSLDSYWESVVSTHGDEAVMPGVDFKGDVVLDIPDTNLPFIRNVRCKAYKQLLGRIQQLTLAGNHIDGWTQRRTQNNTIETTFYRRVFPASTSRRIKTSVSGTVRGADGIKQVQSQVGKIGSVTSTAYKTMLSNDARFSTEKIRSIREAYISTLAMMVAFQQLNPGKNSLIQSIGVGMGNSTRLSVDAPLIWRYSQVLDALVKSVDLAVSDKVHRDSIEGFMPTKNFESDPFDEVTHRPRTKLLSVVEQNEATIEKLAGAYTESTIQFAGMVAAAGVFVAITLLPKTA
jgi:hypothetical protein